MKAKGNEKQRAVSMSTKPLYATNPAPKVTGTGAFAGAIRAEHDLRVGACNKCKK